MFHVSQLRKYVPYPSHVIQRDEVQIRGNLTIETMPIRIEDRKMKQLRGKEIPLVRVACGGASGGSVTWELEGKMCEACLELFVSGTFSRTKIFQVGESCNTLN